MLIPERLEFWFLIGSQHLYGPEVLEHVRSHGREMTDALNARPLFGEISFRGVLTTPEDIEAQINRANQDPNCAGVIVNCHTFSPAQMWTSGLKLLQKPLLHFHTQFNQSVPWAAIDMAFMNENQAAHGDREFAHMCARLKLSPAIVVGHWSDNETTNEIDRWMRAATGLAVSRKLIIARLGDNMRSVAVTEGDKVAARERFGWQVKGFGVGDLCSFLPQVGGDAVEEAMRRLLECYEPAYNGGDEQAWNASVAYQLKVGLAISALLKAQRAQAFTTTFEDLHGLEQLPGLAAQELMAAGYGFGAEGDWKTAGLLAVLNAVTAGRPGGNTFMEAYTYDFPSGLVVGAHMLEVSPAVADESVRPRIEVHPLGIGGKNPPARLVFDVKAGPALDICLVDMGDGFRMIANKVECVTPPEPTPVLPVAKAVWKPQPDFRGATKRWLELGGSHHTVLTTALKADELRMLAGMMNVPLEMIG